MSVVDDPRVGLVREPVSGADDMIDRMTDDRLGGALLRYFDRQHPA